MYPTWRKGAAFSLVVGALALSPILPAATARAGTQQVTVVRASDVGVAAPVHGTTAASNAGGFNRLPRGVRSVRRASGARSLAVDSSAAPAAGPTSKLLANFNGVSSRDSGLVNFNLEFEPPDQGLCVGNGFVVEPVNSAYRIYNTSGKSLAGPFNINDLFNQGALQFTSDPRCYYDPTTNTWFATILFIATNSSGFGTTSDLLIAVNSSGNPFNVWTQYQIDTTDSKNKGCGAHLGGCFGDQPTLGIDQNNLYVTTNEFGINSNTFNGAQVFAFAKSDLVAGNPVHFAVFKNLLNADRSMATSVQPAISTGTPAAEYFLNTLDPSGLGDNRIGVWALTNGAAVATGGTPTLSTTIIGSEPYAVPPNAIQKGSASQLNTGDDRMQQTQFIDGTIWGELDTALNISGDTTTRSAGAWMAVQPTLSSGRISGATVSKQGYVAKAGNYVLYPALQVDSKGSAAMVFTLSGASAYASAATASLAAGSGNFGAIRVAAAGSGPYDPNASRWGDYSWAVIDPTSDAFWLATEYMPPLSSQTPDRAANWGTRVLEVGAG
jgi:hypothetical protein